MINESVTTQVDRFFALLNWQLMAQMPRPGGIHKYSKGNMLNHYVTRKTATGYQIIMSEGVSYSQYAMGYDDSGAKRTPRGPLETINFRTVEQCLEYTRKAIERG